MYYYYTVSCPCTYECTIVILQRRQGQPVSDSEEESDEGATSQSHGAPGELPPSSSEEYSSSEDEVIPYTIRPCVHSQ